MSKSYDNTIPLFAPSRSSRSSSPHPDRLHAGRGPRRTRKLVGGVQILAQFAQPDVIVDTRKRLEAGGMGWGDLKNLLFDVLNDQLGPLRARYNALIEPGSELDDVLTARGRQGAGAGAGRPHPCP